MVIGTFRESQLRSEYNLKGRVSVSVASSQDAFAARVPDSGLRRTPQEFKTVRASALPGAWF